MTKLLASDFDGTLYFRKKPPFLDLSLLTRKDLAYQPEDLQAVKEFQKAGHYFGICTGRPASSIQEFLDPGLQPDFILANSGAIGYSGSGELLFASFIDAGEVAFLLEHLPRKLLTLTTLNHLYSTQDNSILSSKSLPIETLDLSQIGKDPVVGISLVLDTEQQVQEWLETAKSHPLLQPFANGVCLDFVAAGCSKGNGIETLAKLWNVEFENTAAIGDAPNDIPMLEYAATSFTFGQSLPHVQQKADIIVDSVKEAIDVLMDKCQSPSD